MTGTQTWGKLATIIALCGGSGAALLLILAGPGTRWSWWHYRTGLSLFRYAAWLAIAGIVLALLGLALGGARGTATLALLLGAACLAGPLLFSRQARLVPMIHDITTDTDDPPRFVAIVPLRARSPNPPEYDGPEAAAQQHAAYPDIQPIHLDEKPGTAFERALAAARAMEWEIVASEPAEGRIEATATTRWFGFRDDVVIRIRAEGDGSRVDVRSKSRVGRSDLGKNAARIRDFRARLTGDAK